MKHTTEEIEFITSIKNLTAIPDSLKDFIRTRGFQDRRNPFTVIAVHYLLTDEFTGTVKRGVSPEFLKHIMELVSQSKEHTFYPTYRRNLVAYLFSMICVDTYDFTKSSQIIKKDLL